MPDRRRARLEARVETLSNMLVGERELGRRARLERDLRATLVDLHAVEDLAAPGLSGLARFST